MGVYETDLDSWILGNVFLENFYLVLDQENHRVGLSLQMDPKEHGDIIKPDDNKPIDNGGGNNGQNSNGQGNGNGNDNHDPEGSKAGMVIGIIIGILVVIAGAGFGIYYYRKKKASGYTVVPPENSNGGNKNISVSKDTLLDD